MHRNDDEATNYLDVIIHALRDDPVSEWQQKMIEVLQVIKSNGGHYDYFTKVSDQDYQTLLEWAIQKKLANTSVPLVLESVLNTNFSHDYIAIITDVYNEAIKQNKRDVVNCLISSSLYLRRQTHLHENFKILKDMLSNDIANTTSPEIAAMSSQLRDILFRITEISQNIFSTKKLTDEDYQRLVLWAVKRYSPPKIDDSALTTILNDHLSDGKQDIIKKLFFIALKQGKTEIAERIYKNSNYLVANLHNLRYEEQSAEKNGMYYPTVLQYAALYNNTSLCDYWLRTSKCDPQVTDYYSNNCLHFAASSGDSACYDLFLSYSKENNLGWEEQTNIFGHRPIDYLPQNVAQFTRVHQIFIIDKLVKYNLLKADNQTTPEIEEIKMGLCHGGSFLNSLPILGIGINKADFEDLQTALLQSDLTKEGLSKSIQNPNLNEQDIYTVEDAIKYLTSHILYFQNVSKMLATSLKDRSTHLQFINRGQGKLSNVEDYILDETSKKEGDFAKIFYDHLTERNTIIAFTMQGKTLMSGSHSITITIDNNGDIYFSDPNQLFNPGPIKPDEKAKLNNIVNIIHHYKIGSDMAHVSNIHIYKYEQTTQLTQNISAAQDERKHFFETFFFKRVGKEFDLMISSCLRDAPAMLARLLDKQADKLTIEQTSTLIFTSLAQKSYQCTEVLINKYKLDVTQLKEHLLQKTNKNEVDTLLKNFEDYKNNIMIIKRNAPPQAH